MKVQLTLTTANQIKQSDSYETAAWYRDFKSVKGTYALELKEVKPDFYNGHQTHIFSGQIPFELESQNFQSLFCGNSVGKSYDTNKGKGTIEHRTVTKGLLAVIFDSSITIEDEATYDHVLALAKVYCETEFRRYNGYIQDDIKRFDAGDKYQTSLSSHYCQYMADFSKQLKEIESAIGIRAYYAKNPESGHKNYRIKQALKPV